MSSPLVSILIPAYNAEKWIKDAINSALSQTYQNCEVIVVDDGSTDGTPQIAQAMADQYSQKITVVSQKNKGAAAANNHALALARGDLIQYLDADDLLDSRKIEFQVREISTPPYGLEETICMGVWGRFHGDYSQTKWAIKEAVYKARTGVEFLQIKMETHSMVTNSSWLSPKKLCDAAGPWNETLTKNIDGEYFARVALQAKTLCFTPSALSYYRSTIPTSISHQRNAAALDSLYRAEVLTTGYLLNTDPSPRSHAAAALAWRRLASELYLDNVDLAEASRAAAKALGAGDDRPIGIPLWVSVLAKFTGWPRAFRLLRLRNRIA